MQISNDIFFVILITGGKMILNIMPKGLYRLHKIPMLLEKWENLSNLTTPRLKSNLLLIRVGKIMHSTNMLAISFRCIEVFRILETTGKNEKNIFRYKYSSRTPFPL